MNCNTTHYRANSSSVPGDPTARVLEQLVDRAPKFGWAWFDLGRLRRDAGRLDDAEAAFASAAEADPTYDHAGFFAAHAARAAAARGDEQGRAKHAARALQLAPEVARGQLAAAKELLAEGRREEAQEAAEVAAAVAPRDLAVMDVLKKARGGKNR